MRKELLWSATITMVLVSAAWVSDEYQQQVADPKNGPRECPENWGLLRELRDTSLIPAGLPSWFPGQNTGVAEFHDCQKFIEIAEDGQREYMGRFAIFAAPGLGMMDTVLRPISVERPCGVSVEDCPDAGVVTEARPAALIIAEKPYLPLKIRKPGAYCLYLHREGGAWKANLVSLADVEPPYSECLDPVQARGQFGESLKVLSTTEPTIPADGMFYPPAARIDWDPWHEQHYFGLRCGTAWCEVGDPTRLGTSTTEERHAQDVTNKARRAVLIKGWYDEQYLAIDYYGRLVPSNVVGTIYPDQDLGPDPAGIDDDFERNWVRVARVAIMEPRQSSPLDEHTLNIYSTKLGFERTHPDGALNEIFLCNGTRNDCQVRAAVCPNSTDGPNGWWARVVSASGREKPLCVSRMDMTGMQVPATARWRWRPDDEGMWVRCRQGCCELTWE